MRRWLQDEHCLYRHQHLLDWFGQYIQAYKGKRKMGWAWIVDIGHNNEWLSRKLDPHLLEFFERNKDEVTEVT